MYVCVNVQKTPVNGNMSFSELGKYSYQVLCSKTELPDGLDPSHKEVVSGFSFFLTRTVSKRYYCLLMNYKIISHCGSRAGSGVVRIDPFRFLAGCRKRRLNQAMVSIGVCVYIVVY